MQTDAKSLSQERFGRYAEGYVNSPTHARGSGLDRLIEIVRPQPSWRALDVATGGGHTALLFAPHVQSLVASDLTPEMLAAAEAHLVRQGITNVSFHLADAETLPFEDGEFDLVTCRLAAHHFPAPERFVQGAARVLRAGGTLIMQDQVTPDDDLAAAFINDFERLRDPSHHVALQRAPWEAHFVAAGLTVRRVDTLAQRHELLDWAARQGCNQGTVTRLAAMLADAPTAAREWLDPQHLGTPEASFLIHQIILCATR